MSRKSRGLPPHVLDPDAQIERLAAKIRDCQEKKFYGTVTLHIQAGNLERWETRQIEKLMPEEVTDGESGTEAQADGEQAQEAAEVAEQARQAS